MRSFLVHCVVVFGVSGCNMMNKPLSSGANASLSPTGAQLYQKHCAECHGPLEATDVPDRSTQQVNDAIENVGGMLSLQSLSTREIAEIVLALRSDLDLIPPAPPAGIVGVAQGHSSIALAWNAATDNVGGSGIDGYRITRNGATLITLESATLTYVDGSLSASTTYQYQLFSTDKAGNESVASQTITVTTPEEPVVPDTTAPSIPQNLTANIQGTSRAQISWSASVDEAGGSGLSGYRLYYNGVLLRELNAGTRSYLQVNLAAGAAHSFQVSAVDNAGNESNRTAGATLNTPAANGAALYSQHCQFCHGPFDASDVRNFTAAQISTAIVEKPLMNSLSFLSTDEIAAIALHLSDSSDTTPPTAPGAFVANSTTSRSVSLTWTVSTDSGGSGLRGYQLFRNNTAIGSLLGPSVLSFNDASLTPQTAYSYRIRAVDNAGNLSVNANSSATTAADPPVPDTAAPSIPGSFQATSSEPNRVVLRWAASSDTGGSGVAGYEIYRNGVLLTTVAAITYSDTNVSSATEYRYKIRAKDGANNISAFSAERTVTTALPDGTVLYTQKGCSTSSCHGGLSDSNLRFRAGTVEGFANLYRNALLPLSQGGIPEMQNRPLRDVEMNAIAALLAGDPSDPTNPQLPANFVYSHPIGTRTYVSSLLTGIFVNTVAPTTNDTAIQAIINSQVTFNAPAFGGACSRYDATCPQNSGSLEAFNTASQSPLVSVVRAGYIQNTCAQILEIPNAVTNALARAGLTTGSAATAANVAALYQVYFPARSIPSALSAKLRNIHSTALATPLTGTVAWQMVNLPLCEWAAMGGL